ncbi:MAG TPA: BTAD domain-containing putative transcriptional regulator, partial [Gemmatimonadaceae bacterium]
MELRTLGSVQLDAPGRPEARSVGAQPKRLALLAYLALAEPRGAKRRDALLALLWPESSQEKGRQVLRQTVYLLRRSLGAHALVTRSDDELELDTSVVACDARRFEDLIASGDSRAALDVYRGDFLDGFFVSGVEQEFEEWVSDTRQRLRGMASTAAWAAAAEDERNGHGSSALHWARRATQLNRDSETGVRDLMLLHQRLGDRVGALREFESYAGRIEREVGAKPGADLVRLAQSLRTDAGAPAAAVGAPPIGASPQPVAPTSRAAFPRWRVAIASAVGLAVIFAAFATRNRAPATFATLAVGPIVDVVSQDSSAEAPVAGDLLATSIARLTGARVIPAVRLYDVQAQLRGANEPATLLAAARQAGAAEMLRGTIHRAANGALTFDGQIIALASGTVVRTLRTDGRDVFELVDRTTDELAQQLGVAAPERSIADVTTRSFVAYRLYQEGLRAFYAPDVRSAKGLFHAAVAEDSTFAMATYFDGVAGMLLGQSGALDVLDRAARLALKAPDRER